MCLAQGVRKGPNTSGQFQNVCINVPKVGVQRHQFLILCLRKVFTDIVLVFSQQTDRQYDAHQAHRSSKPPKDSYLVEQVFSPHHFPPSVKSHVKGSPLYTDLRLTGVPDGKRPQPSWTIEEFKRNSGDKSKLSALDLQVRMSFGTLGLFRFD